MSYTINFKEAFAAFLEENFATRAEAEAWTGKCDRQIDNYLDAVCRPAPELVAKAFLDVRTRDSAYRHFGGTVVIAQRPLHRLDPRRIPKRAGTSQHRRRSA